jgi:uncharacterized protein
MDVLKTSPLLDTIQVGLEHFGMTTEELNGMSRKELAEKARQLGVPGASTLKKEDLVASIGKVIKKQAKQAAKAAPSATSSKATPITTTSASPAPKVKVAKTTASATKTASAKVATPVVLVPPIAPQRNGTHSTKPSKTAAESPTKKPLPVATTAASATPNPNNTRDISSKSSRNGTGQPHKDRMVVMVRDPYWLHAYWELTHQSVQRAEAALGQDWYGAKPILRLSDVTAQDTTSTAESTVRDIEIHGGSNNWYIEVPQPPKSYRVDVGYLARRGNFYVIARSNVVTTPKAGSSDTIDENWSDFDEKQAERIFAMSSGFDPHANGSLELKQLFEERLRRPMGSVPVASFAGGANGKDRKFFFEINAELIVYGRTESGARVTLQGEPVSLRPDGTFTMRYGFPDGRQIIPAVAASTDGVEERTIVLAVERNTKALEPMVHDSMNEI